MNEKEGTRYFRIKSIAYSTSIIWGKDRPNLTTNARLIESIYF